MSAEIQGKDYFQIIVSGKITSNTTKNNTNIEKYLYDNIENNASKLNSEREDRFSNSSSL